ncbi:MAG TPA: RES family NAD+ phosphorylase [Thermoanaerobaculia bacterium]
MITAWRITADEYASGAFKGDGARLYGGRWTSSGVAAVYVSSSAALAALEILVHAKRRAVLRKYVLFACSFAEALVETVDRPSLRADWRGHPAPMSLKEIGDRWVNEGRSAVLQVPSAIIDTESNYLLNPLHPDFAGIEIADPTPFTLDVRLLR